ncbi:MAG: ferrous iron transport protein B [Desulfobulbaceae bacterium S3730MH12]|nr:MAG: ferrous iron transport protein B [Desulfobulbaceae bacterium S5133MH15]OEU55136.1 MAG: ferrous iron transport protein B [Desulfobulbaceae bacterium S3730MH12]OEU78956.1 MAG: ferrous iron transport protein B [Desulfobulbaceae bacterium C00003063]
MQLKIALAGNPNAGKTTLFNQLTGARQHVGNYPGITVDHKEGCLLHKNKKITITDLPGTYSMTAYSAEELVARDYLVNEKPDVVIDIVDSSNLERNLYLTIQFLELGVPLVIALNMIDVAKDRGIEIKVEKLSQLLGVPVIPIIARSGFGEKDLLEAAIDTASTSNNGNTTLDISYGKDLDSALPELISLISENNFMTDTYPARYTAIKYLENDEQILKKGRQNNTEIASRLEEIVDKLADHTRKTLDVYPEAIIADQRYGYIKSIIRQGVETHRFDTDRLYTSDKIDKVLTNRLVGPIIMLLIIFGLYQFTFSWSELPITWLESFFGWLGGIVENTLPDGLLKSMIISGVIDGVGGILGFVPLIMFMFFGIAILEDSGYLARVAFMMDRVFRMFGLHGSSVMPFIVSGGIAGGCAVPGVMATRTLRSPKERMATLLTVPFMNCGAKVPVLALLIGAFFAESKALYMFLFTMLAWVVALLAAKLLRTTVLRGDPTPFVMELPPYRFPTIRGLLIHTWERTYQYIKKAGTVILGISILLWALMTFPGLDNEQKGFFKQQRQETISSFSQETVKELDLKSKPSSEEAIALAKKLNTIDNAETEAALRYSIAGRVGRSMESITRFAGFDWRTNIALIGGFAAKEVIVSTLGTAYSMGEVNTEEPESLGERLKNDSNWNRVVAVSALVFIMFYAPCFITVVCIAKESSWKWAFFSIGFNTFFAFLAAVAIYQIGMFFQLG